MLTRQDNKQKRKEYLQKEEEVKGGDENEKTWRKIKANVFSAQNARVNESSSRLMSR